MPKVSIYLPDDLYREARDRRLPLSALAQEAIEVALRRGRTDAWVAQVRARSPRRPPGSAPIDTAELLDRVREDFGS
jgi:hypothetical protein